MEIPAWKMDLPETYYETLDNFPHDTTVKSRLNERTWCKKYRVTQSSYFLFFIFSPKQNPTISRTICSPLNKWFLIPKPEWGGRRRMYKTKHCQRHNGPEGWVLLTKVTSLGHITSSNTNLDQTSSESRPCINFKISTKHHHFDKT